MQRRFVLQGVLLWSAIAVAAGSATAAECALPVVVRSALRDIQESWFNGPEGYAFIVEAGAEKTGTLPLEVGRDPVLRFDAAVYASNFQGPILVRHPDLRPQWEWTADGESQVSERSYPLLAARACAESASVLPVITLHVDEHDEWPWVNDPLGAFAVDLARCREVLSETRKAGWTSRQHSDGLPYAGVMGGARDVEFVEYLLWCYRCDTGSRCDEGIAWRSDAD
jgi:hypothetical protein